MRSNLPPADVCLLLEGSYPYVAGGVSSWVQDLIRAQSHLRFSLVALVADRRPRRLLFDLPANVVGLTEICLQDQSNKVNESRRLRRLVDEVSPPLRRLLERGTHADLVAILEALRRAPDVATRENLLNSRASWTLVTDSYRHMMPSTSFLDFFWSWRGLAGGLLATLLAPLPEARIYHAVSTGYAGLTLARAVAETGRPGLLTEHGIYTNERRVEIAMASWLHDRADASLEIEKNKRDLRDLWIDAFVGFSRACYEASSEIITLYGGNQDLQIRDGAPRERLRIIPNGVDYGRLSALPRDTTPRRPTVALIGRVVPIKDVKTYIRAAALLREAVPDVQALVLGPTEEDPAYVQECRDMVTQLRLEDTVSFTGAVKLVDWLGRIDALVLTSISEAQPLVILEAGSAGVPAVATDVGSCREMLFGGRDEVPSLGQGGFVTPLSNPLATANALAALLLDPERRAECGRILQRRVETTYNKVTIDRIYGDLYERYRHVPALPRAVLRGAA